MSFNLNRADNDLQLTANQFKITSSTHASNIIIDVSNDYVTMINLNPYSTNFIGFMANSTGLYMKTNGNASSYDQIGNTSVYFTPNIALELTPTTNLNVLYNPDILSIDGLNRLNIANGAIQNNKLANSTITIGGQTVSLGNSLGTVDNWTVSNLLTSDNGNIGGILYFANMDNYIHFNADSGKLNITGDIEITNTLETLNDVSIGGNLYVTGNTYFINSNITTITDPVVYLGSNTVPFDITDRGIAFRYQSNSVAKIGFMGFQQETQEFIYIPDASETPDNNFFGANGDAHFGNVKVDSNLVILSNGYLNFNNSSVGLRYNNGNLEVKYDGLSAWNKLFTLADLDAGNGLIKSGADNLTLDIVTDNSTLEINADSLQVKNAGITNSKLANSAISVDGVSLTLGSSYSNLVLSLDNAYNYPVSNLVGTLKNNQLANSAISIDGISLALGSSYSNLVLSLDNSYNYPASNLVGTITNTQLANSSIIISGTTYTLGTAYSNIILTNSNALVFRSEANTYIKSNATSNLDISGTGNVNISANTDIILATQQGSGIKFRGPTGSNQFSIIQATNGNVYLNIGQTTGDTGYGIRSNIAGGLEFKNSGGSWTGFGTGSGGGIPGGSNTQIQFNDANSFGGSSNFTFNKSTSNVQVTGNIQVSVLSSATHVQASNTFTISQYTSGLSNISGTQTITLDFNQGSNFLITLSAGANVTLANPSNISRLGQQGIIVFKTPSSGTSHVLNWYRGTSSAWFFPDIVSPPQISAGQNIYDVFNFMVVDTTSNGKVLVTDATGFQQYV